MDAIILKVVGHPKPQARPRVFRAYGRVMTHSPKTSWYYIVYTKALEIRPEEPLDVPLMVEIDFIMPRPKTRKNDVWCATRPDSDNLAKGVLDAMSQAGFWRDDSLICRLLIIKRYQFGNEQPGAIISVKDMP